MPVQKVTVKIGPIEHRSNFSASDGSGGYIGLELGADIAAGIDLDDFMVFGNDAEKAKLFFRELLFKHVAADLDDQRKSAPLDSAGLIAQSLYSKHGLR